MTPFNSISTPTTWIFKRLRRAPAALASAIRRSSFGLRTQSGRRRASVLIIVIVLLLLLAILGAAYISTTRSSRVASAQNVMNNDVDSMLNGVAKICEGTIVDDLNDTFGNLHGNTAYTGNTVTNRSFYQGQAGASPPLLPNVYTTTNAGAYTYTYNPGDILNDTTDPVTFYYVPPTAGGGSAAVTLSTNLTAAPAGTFDVMNGHLPVTALGSTPWLAERIPDPAGTKSPLWTAITQTLQYVPATAGATPTPATLAPQSIIGTDFDDPTLNPPSLTSTLEADIAAANPNVPGLVGVPGAASASALTPTYETLANGLNVPAFSYGAGGKFVAGNASGDGIADSLLFQIPGASLNGLTWYAAVKIIDNNSAINVNTAWSRDGAAASGAQLTSGEPDNWNLFPTSVGLYELINASDNSAPTPKFTAFNTYRFGNTATAAADPLDESIIAGNMYPGTVDRTSGTKDYTFIGPTEAYYMQFIRRMANPGYNTAAERYAAIPYGDQASLASHYVLTNPSTSTPETVLESLLPSTLYWQANSTTTPNQSTPYDPSNVAGWFAANFNYAATATDALTLPARPLFVVHNPVSNYIWQGYNNNNETANGGVTVLPGPTAYDPLLPSYMLPYGTSEPVSGSSTNAPRFKGVWSNTTAYNLNDIVVAAGPTPPGLITTYISLGNANTGNTPNTTVGTAWRIQPWNTNPAKANINTATFAELFRDFWLVMAGNPSNMTPFGETGVDNYNIYDNAPTVSATGQLQSQLIFRSTLRDFNATAAANVSLTDIPNTTTTVNGVPQPNVTNTNMMLIRAALAAANTIALRDNRQNVISKTIVLQNSSQVDSGGAATPAQLEVEVFSNAPQPVISEVYASTFTGADAVTNTANPQGYIAVELYNPTSVPMTLYQWQLGLINRATTTGAAPNKLAFETFGALLNSPSIIGPMIYTQNNPLPDPSKPGVYDLAPTQGYIYIPAHGYALLENYNANTSGTANTGDATCRPISAVSKPITGTGGGSFYTSAAATPPNTIEQTGIWYGPGGINTPNVCDVYVQNLQLVITGALGSTSGTGSTGGELVLLRPRRADGTYSQSSDPQNTFTEGTYAAPYLFDLVPVDSFDFSGIPAPNGTLAVAWSYIRVKGGQSNVTTPTTPNTWFKAFFPGFYNGFATAPNPREAAYPPTGLQGTGLISVTPATQNMAWPTSGSGVTEIDQTPIFGNDSLNGSYSNPYPPIQIYDIGFGNAGGDPMHFPNSLVSPVTGHQAGIATGTPGFFPLGQFARNGDMLDIPFVGAYRVRIGVGASSQVGTANFLEMNSLPKDISFVAVENAAPGIPPALAPIEDAAENVGRFVPMTASYQYVKYLAATPQAAPPATPQLSDYYSWARNLFNYFTVQSSSDAYLPNIDPNISPEALWLPNNAPSYPFLYPPYNSATPVPPTPVFTGDATATDETKQDNVGVEGLVNINTASWKVLSMLPFVPSSVGGAAGIDQQIAQNIVNYRLTHGPFTSIFDLNQVPGFQSGTSVSWTPSNVLSTALPAPTIPWGTGAAGPSSAEGLLSPADPGFGTSAASNAPTGIGEDYQWDTFTLDRISNLVTTRSDTFTVYIEVQGWQNVGLTSGGKSIASPVITRRYAFIVDRTGVNADPTTRYLKTVVVPNN